MNLYHRGEALPSRPSSEEVAFVPAAHTDLPLWCQNFKGTSVELALTGLSVLDTIDDLWTDEADAH